MSNDTDTEKIKKLTIIGVTLRISGSNEEAKNNLLEALLLIKTRCQEAGIICKELGEISMQELNFKSAEGYFQQSYFNYLGIDTNKALDSRNLAKKARESYLESIKK